MPNPECSTCSLLGPLPPGSVFCCPACGADLGGDQGAPAGTTKHVSEPAPRQFSAAFLSRYEILSTLGQGGMGVVYLAKQRNLDRSVAIKLTHAKDADTRARFSREGRLLAKLNHPNIVQVYEAGEDIDQPFLVCEVVDGEALSARLTREGALPVAAALDVGTKIAAGLGYAHSQGVLHRDLKSANVLLSKGGAVKVCDFGLARAVEMEASITSTGLLLGTPSHMSPELVRGAPATILTDVYALGCVLFEMLTGSAPFPSVNADGSRRSVAEVLNAHLHAPVPLPTSIKPDLPQVLVQLVVRCLAKQPEFRPENAGEVERQLVELKVSPTPGRAPVVDQQVVPPADVTVTPAGTKRRKDRGNSTGRIAPVPIAAKTTSSPVWKSLLIGFCLFSVVGAGGGLAWYRSRSEPALEGAEVAEQPLEKIATGTPLSTRSPEPPPRSEAQPSPPVPAKPPPVVPLATPPVTLPAAAPDLGDGIPEGCTIPRSLIGVTLGREVPAKFKGSTEKPDSQFRTDLGCGTLQFLAPRDANPMYLSGEDEQQNRLALSAVLAKDRVVLVSETIKPSQQRLGVPSISPDALTAKFGEPGEYVIGAYHSIVYLWKDPYTVLAWGDFTYFPITNKSAPQKPVKSPIAADWLRSQGKSTDFLMTWGEFVTLADRSIYEAGRKKPRTGIAEVTARSDTSLSPSQAAPAFGQPTHISPTLFIFLENVRFFRRTGLNERETNPHKMLAFELDVLKKQAEKLVAEMPHKGQRLLASCQQGATDLENPEGEASLSELYQLQNRVLTELEETLGEEEPATTQIDQASTQDAPPKTPTEAPFSPTRTAAAAPAAPKPTRPPVEMAATPGDRSHSNDVNAQAPAVAPPPQQRIESGADMQVTSSATNNDQGELTVATAEQIALMAPSSTDDRPEAKKSQENLAADKGGFTEADRKESKDLYDRGLGYVETFEYATAQRLFLQSFKLLPTADCANQIGELHLKANNLKAAAKCFQAALKLLPGYRRAAVNLEVTKKRYLHARQPAKAVPQE